MSVKYTREPGCFRQSGLTHHVVGMPNSSGPSTRQTRLTRRRVESSSINLDQIPFGLRAAACLRATPPHVTRVCHNCCSDTHSYCNVSSKTGRWPKRGPIVLRDTMTMGEGYSINQSCYSPPNSMFVCQSNLLVASIQQRHMPRCIKLPSCRADSLEYCRFFSTLCASVLFSIVCHS